MAFTPMSLVVVLARNFTPQELCVEADKCDPVDAGKYLDALAVHASRTSWGDLVERSINRWEEVDGGEREGQAPVRAV